MGSGRGCAGQGSRSEGRWTLPVPGVGEEEAYLPPSPFEYITPNLYPYFMLGDRGYGRLVFRVWRKYPRPAMAVALWGLLSPDLGSRSLCLDASGVEVGLLYICMKIHTNRLPDN